MKIEKTKLGGVFILKPDVFEDQRGQFIKVFNKDLFDSHRLPFVLEESYFSISRKNVLRGMHFQVPPKDHTKLVYVTSGAITDVILDLRANSPTYGKHLAVELSRENHAIVYIPSGFAHGFLSLENNTLVVYLQSSVYSPTHDSGIRADSFGMNWAVTKPIMSTRDKAFPKFRQFKTPFVFKPSKR